MIVLISRLSLSACLSVLQERHIIKKKYPKGRKECDSRQVLMDFLQPSTLWMTRLAQERKSLSFWNTDTLTAHNTGGAYFPFTAPILLTVFHICLRLSNFNFSIIKCTNVLDKCNKPVGVFFIGYSDKSIIQSFIQSALSSNMSWKNTLGIFGFSCRRGLFTSWYTNMEVSSTWKQTSLHLYIKEQQRNNKSLMHVCDAFWLLPADVHVWFGPSFTPDALNEATWAVGGGGLIIW